MQPKRHNLIAPNTYQESLCSAFSNEVYQTNKDMYAQRNQNNESKIKNDIYIGKLAEFAVYNYLIYKGKTVSAPDIMIYESKKKSYDADLYINKESPLHIKSCIDIGVQHNSWLFQPNDPITNAPTEDDMIAFVVITPEAVFYCYIIKASDILDMYREPRNQLLNKKVIYEIDLTK